MKNQTFHIIIRGKVQGVFYRKSTQKKALELGLTGWVKNLKDGSVELEAEGTISKLEELASWCKEGPKNAIVKEIEIREISPKNYENFQIL